MSSVFSVIVVSKIVLTWKSGIFAADIKFKKSLNNELLLFEYVVVVSVLVMYVVWLFMVYLELYVG